MNSVVRCRWTWFGCLVFGAASAAIGAEHQWVDGSPAAAVWGQPDYNSAIPGQSNRKLNVPDSIAVDTTTGKVFVSDAGNHRVLRFASFAALENGLPAEAVLGQGDFTTVVPAGTRSRMDNPKGISVDPQGRLWVADSNNHRILRFDDASTRASGANANGVLGQPDFTSTDAGGGAAGMGYVAGVFADSEGRVWVSDWDNRRVTRFDNAAVKANGADADAVLGQPDFDTNREATDQASLRSPAGLFLDANRNLWVADIFQARVMMFLDAPSKENGANAHLVLGQLEFTTANMNQTSWGLSQPSGVIVDGNGDVWVTDQLFHRVLRYVNPAASGHGMSAATVLGQPHFLIADWGRDRDSLNMPEGVGLDANGDIWVADRENHRLLKFERAVYQPDGLVGRKRSGLIGDGLYTRTGEGQEVALKMRRSKKFWFSAQNDGNNYDAIRVRGTGKNRKVVVRYFRVSHPAENITAKVSRLGYLIDDLEPGGTVRFKARVFTTELSQARSVSKILRILSGSDSDGSVDRAKVKATTYGAVALP